MKDYLNYNGQNCIVIGGCSGTGKAISEILMDCGAYVYGLDLKESGELTKFIHIDLSDKDSLDDALTELPERIDKIFCTAGVPGMEYLGRKFTLEQVFAINFLGIRHLVEAMVPRMPAGGAIMMLASIAAINWENNLLLLDSIYQTSSFEDGLEWLKKNAANPNGFDNARNAGRVYAFTKECMIYYCKKKAFGLSKLGIRLNVQSPGGILSPMTADFNKRNGLAPDAVSKGSNPAIGRASLPIEQAKCSIFLNSDLAPYVSGINMIVDYGVTPAVRFGQCNYNNEIFE